MSSTGVGSVAPSRTSLTTPARSTTNSRWLSPGGEATYIGVVKSPGLPTGVSWSAAPALAGTSSASAPASSSALVIRDMPALGFEREPPRRPLVQSADHRVSVPAGTAEGVGRHPRPRTQPAVEDDRRVARDRLRLGRQPLELDVPRAGDPARVVLVGLAHVDQLDLAALERGADLVGVDVDVVGMEGVGHRLRRLRPRAACLRPGPRLVRHEPVGLARPRAQQRPRVTRIDDLLDTEALGRPER